MKKKLLFIFIPIIVLLIIPFFKPIIPIVNMEHFPLSLLSTINYKATRNKVYYVTENISQTGEFKNIQEITGATLFNSKVLGYRYLVSDLGVYLNGEKINGVDPGTFKRLNYFIAFDENKTYLINKELSGLKLNNPELFKESSFIYKSDTPLSYNSDISHYIKDGDKIIGIGKKPINGETIDNGNGLINSRNWFNIPTKDLKTFKIFYYKTETYYSKTSKEVFFYDQIVDGADSETFEIIGEIKDKIYAKDKSNYYLDGKVLTGEELEEYLNIQE